MRAFDGITLAELTVSGVPKLIIKPGHIEK